VALTRTRTTADVKPTFSAQCFHSKGPRWVRPVRPVRVGLPGKFACATR
jgi:hypothetical protein